MRDSSKRVTVGNNTHRFKQIFTAGLMTCLYLLMFLTYAGAPFFGSDEGDIFHVGWEMANGQILYKDVISQHMPVMYYISALFVKLGMDTVLEYRIYFYVLFSIMLGGIFYIYGKKIGYKLVGLSSVLYIAVIGYIDMGYSALSDQVQAIGFMMLFYELLIFVDKKKLNWTSIVCISFAIFLSFGSSFVAAFSIFALGCTVFALEVQDAYYVKKGFVAFAQDLWKKYWRLILAVAVPFAAMCTYHIITGSFQDFIFQAYTINRTIYPQYLGGYGDSIFNSIYIGVSSIVQCFTLELSNLTATSLLYFLLVCSSIFFSIRYLPKIYGKSNIVFSIGSLAFVITASTRGATSFHGVAAVAILCIMLAFTLMDVLESAVHTHVAATVIVVMIIMVFSKIITAVPEIQASVNPSDSDNTPDVSYGHVIDVLTDDYERIGIALYNGEYVVESKTIPLYGNASCPWIWEFSKERAMQEYQTVMPRVFLYNPNYATWGYPIIDYAEELNEFIENNYVSLESFGYIELYVRKDYYREALVLLQEDYKQQVGHTKPLVSSSVSDDGSIMCITLKIDDYYSDPAFAVWSDAKGQDDLQWYYPIEVSPGVWKYLVDLREHNTVGSYNIHVYATHDDEQECILMFSEEVTALADPSNSTSVPLLGQTNARVDHIDPITPDRQIEQHFTLLNDSILSQIVFEAGTYSKENQGTIAFSIWESDTNEEITSVEMNLAEVKDNIETIVEVEPVSLEAGRQYYLKVIVSPASPEDTVTIYRSEDGTAESDLYAVVDGEKTDYTLCIDLIGKFA